MDYASFPKSDPVIPPSNSNTVGPNNVYGSSTYAAGSIFNLGGPEGVSIDGTDGIYAGSSVPANAPFWVDLEGNLVATSATIATNPGTGTGGRIVINPVNGSIQIFDEAGLLVGAIYAGTSNLFISPNLSASSAGLTINNGSNTTSLTTNLVPGSTLVLQAADDVFNSTDIILTPNTLGFFGTAGTNQPTVTGSKGGNAALASLLSGLAGLGLIVDSTT